MHPLSASEARQFSLVCEDAPAAVEPGDSVQISVLIKNGTAVEAGADGPNPIYLACHWLDSSGQPHLADVVRVPLAPSTPAHGERTYSLTVPPPVAHGAYTLRVTIVQEWIRWFDEEGVYCDLPIEIRSIAWWDSASRDRIVYGNIEALNKHRFAQHLSHNGIPRPLMLHVETVNICNLKCIICPYTEMTREKQTMPMDLFAKIISDYSEWGGGDVIVTPQVGDALLDKKLVERLRLLKSTPGIRAIGFVTNGVNANVFNDQDLGFILNSCTRMNVSIYGLDAEEFGKMTLREHKFETLIVNLKRMIRLNRSCTLVFALRVLRKYTDKQVRQWMHDNFDQEFPYEMINEFGNWAGARDTTVPLPFDAKWSDEHVASQLEEGGPCAYPIYHVKVMVNGDVKFCSCVDFDNATENTIGNVKDDSLQSIYNGDRARRLWREGLSMCNGCTHRKPLADLDRLYPYFAEPVKGLGV